MKFNFGNTGCLVVLLAYFFGILFCQVRLAYGAPPSGRTALVMDVASPRAQMIKDLFLDFATVPNVPSALNADFYHLAIIDATPANLAYGASGFALRDILPEFFEINSHARLIRYPDRAPGKASKRDWPLICLPPTLTKA
jgi:hypothetical protein